jgi:hypothetical protein
MPATNALRVPRCRAAEGRPDVRLQPGPGQHKRRPPSTVRGQCGPVSELLSMHYGDELAVSADDRRQHSLAVGPSAAHLIESSTRSDVVPRSSIS